MRCIQAITEEYRTRMYRLLELYQQAHDPNQPLVCMDEKSKQLLEDSRQPILAKPGQLEKYDYEYKRKGTCNIFVAVAPKAGMRVVKVTDTRKKEDFAYFVEDLIENHFPKASCIQLVLDNLNTHFATSIIETFDKTKADRILERIKFIHTLRIISSKLEISLPILFFLSLDKNDIPQSKRQVFDIVAPTIKTLISEFIEND